MTRAPALRTRLVRTIVLTSVLGVALTSACYVFVRNDVERLERQRVDRPATDALLGVQHLMASVDQVLSTANGVVATSGLDPLRFSAVLRPDVDTSPTLAGMALVTGSARAPRVVARVGDTHLLTDAHKQFARTPTSTLVASGHRGKDFELGFATLVADGAAMVYLEVTLPTAPAGTPFALATRGAVPRVVLGTVAGTSGLTPWSEPVSFAGQRLTLLVRAGDVPGGLLGVSLPVLVLIVGIALTILALVVAVIIVRREDAARHLGDENRELDRALEQQRIVEGELRAWQERFRTILRDSPDVIVLYDAEHGTCDVLNRGDILGHPLDVVAAAGGLYSLVDPADRDEADAHWASMRELEPEHVCEATLRLRAADGETRYARLRFSTLELDGDEVPRLLGSISDVTDQRTNELREVELEEALRRSQRLEAVGQLAGGVAHDFNNLLAAILASAELLGDDVPPGRPREYTEEIQRSALRGAALVRQLLTFAQQDRAEPRVVDLNEIVVGMDALLRRSLGEHVQLQITTTDCSANVLADPTHLEQVILNLAVNARDAMPTGGVLWIATSISFDDTGMEQDCVVLSVADTGSGISPDIRDRIFEPFVTSKAPGKGTGLGLSTVQGIVQSMAGAIEVQSKVGEGTTFEISFARCFDRAAPPDRRDALGTPAPSGMSRRVLLIEDETPVRVMLGHTLETCGFTFTAVSGAADALQVLEQYDFDVVLTDAVMPGMSGPELIDVLRTTRPELPVVLMSGYSRDLIDDRLRGSPPQLRKPFTTQELLAVLERALSSPAVA